MRPALLDRLFASVNVLPGIGPQLARLLERDAGPLVLDVLWHLPVGLVDRRASPPLNALEDGSIVTLKLRVEKHEAGFGRRPYRVICGNETGFITLIYFSVKGDYLQRQLPVGAERIVSGRVELYGRIPQIAHPDFVVPVEEADRLKPIEPVYPLTAGLSPRIVQRAAAAALERAPELPEWLDPALRERRHWPAWRTAIEAVHNPETEADLAPEHPARERLAYDEILASQLAVAVVRARRRRRPGRGRDRLPLRPREGQGARHDPRQPRLGGAGRRHPDRRRDPRAAAAGRAVPRPWPRRDRRAASLWGRAAPRPDRKGQKRR